MKDITTATTNILKEQFIPDNVFMYVVQGAIHFFDGNKKYLFRKGECGVAKKNCLAKFTLPDNGEIFQPVLFCFDEAFLQQFQKKHKIKSSANNTKETFIKIRPSGLMDDFIHSLKPYRKGVMQLDEAFEDVKYEELLIILLKQQPELAGIFFNYNKPEKINLEAFMNKNFKFNVSVERFAYLTGRSLSAFKRDFKTIFNDTPNRWLIQKRLQEAYFLIDRKKQKPSDIYLELGFETLSHFSYAFKKQFGLTLTELTNRTKKADCL
jgi:AraC-like DNA-binding protein